MASLFTQDEDDASFKSSWTVSIMSSFSWLKNSSGNDDQTPPDEAIEVKLDEIRTCLDGNHAEQVNLWQLRQLALSKGGLLSHSIRKRAWPKLLGAHEQVLLHSSRNGASKITSNTHAVMEITQHDMELLEYDLNKPTAWNIEDHVWRNRLSEKQKQVTFLPGLTCVSPAGSLVKISEHEGGTASPMTCNTPYSEVYASTASTTTTTPLHHAYTLLPRSAQEELAVRNIIIGVLREEPSDRQDEDDRYHYYRGLTDLTSLLLINLESPSLTCLTLKKLAKYSLRHAFENNSSASLEHSIQLVSNALLEHVDSLLICHLRDVMWHDDDIVTKTIAVWIPTWFVSSLKDFKLASRILDVLLVSHATMPIYLAVAIMCRNRERLLEASDPATLHRVMRHLPRRLEREQNSMEALEQVIETALDYIRLYPPHVLVPSATVACNPTSHMLMDSTPPFATVSSAPTDWNLLQQAKSLREHGIRNGVSIKDDDATKTTYFKSSKYPLAVAAMGQARKKSRWRLAGIALVVIVLVAATASTTLSDSFQSVIRGTIVPEPPVPTSKSLFSVPWKHSSSETRNTKATRKSIASARPSRRAIVGSRRPVSKQAVTITASRRPTEKNALAKVKGAVKQWRQDHFSKEQFSRLATNVLVQSDNLRWNGQRFLI